MQNRIVQKLIHVLIAGAFSLAAHAGSAATREYRFSPSNQGGLLHTAAYWSPIVAHVDEKSGVRLTLWLGRVPADTVAYAKSQAVEFIFESPLLLGEHRSDWKVFARRANPSERVQVIVAAGSGLRNLRDLEGRMIAFDRPESLGGYVLPHAELKARGVRKQPLFTGPVDGLALLQFGRVDAAVATESFLSGALAPVAGTYRVLWTSPPLPDLALMASGRVAPEDIAAVAKAFVELGRDPKGRSLLERNAKRVGGSEATFINSDESEYFADQSLNSIFAVRAPAARREPGALAER